jgi:hypothetical protein
MSSSAAQIDDPQTLSGLFPPDSDDEEEEEKEVGELGDGQDQNCYEIQSIDLVGETIQIRQYDYHSHNANRIWPGLFPLAEYLLQQQQQQSGPPPEDTTTITNDTSIQSDARYGRGKYVHQWGRILELGTATGLLAIRLAMASAEMNQRDNGNIINNYCCTSIVTSDVEDENGDIASNLMFNYTLNQMSRPFPYHIPHTWGTGFQQSLQRVIDQEMATLECEIEINNTAKTPDFQDPTNATSTTRNQNSRNHKHPLYQPFDTIIASDILLYVSAYPALVQTLSELMIPSSSSSSQLHENYNDEASLLRLQTSSTTTTSTLPKTRFIMSWNRRLKESQEFFERMKDAGFSYEHHGKGIYTFVYDNHQQPT